MGWSAHSENPQNRGCFAMQDNQQTLAPGLRRLSPAMLATDDIAARFGDLPLDATRGQVLAAFKRAAPYLGITPRLVHFVDLLFSWSLEQDWENGARPIVWPSNALLQEELGLGRTQVKCLIRCSIELGLITAVDSPTGKRYGHRDSRGRIVDAYGFSLAPLGVRFEEFAAAAEAAREEREARKALRRRLTIAGKAVAQLAETGQDYDVAGEDWPALVETAREIAAVGRQAETLAELEAAVTSLERRREAAESLVKDALFSVESDPTEPEYRPHITITNYLSSDYKSDTKTKNHRPHEFINDQEPNPSTRTEPCKAWQAKPQGQAARSRFDSANDELAFDTAASGIRPSHLVEISNSIEVYLGQEEATWPNLIEAAYMVRHDLGVSQHAWADACRRMGRNAAAACIALIDSKRLEIASPGGYLRAMTQKHVDGDLNLPRSFYGLRRGTKRLQ